MSLKKSSNTIHYSAGDRVFLAADALILGLVFLLVLYPLLFVLSSSFSGGSEISSLSLIPDQFSLEGYKAAVEYDYFWGSYWNSAVYTAVGTLVAMVVTILCAYPLSQQNFRAGKIAMGLCVFTMYFSGGLIPTYLWIRTLGLMNSPWAFLLPSALNIYNMIVMRTYFVSLPEDIREAAQIDGANYRQTLRKIIIPLVMPSITICSFLSLTDCFKMYDQNLALTGGAPGTQTAMLAMDICNTYYNRIGFAGIGQAKAVVFTVLVFAIAMVQLRATRSKEVE